MPTTPRDDAGRDDRVATVEPPDLERSKVAGFDALAGGARQRAVGDAGNLERECCTAASRHAHVLADLHRAARKGAVRVPARPSARRNPSAQQPRCRQQRPISERRMAATPESRADGHLNSTLAACPSSTRSGTMLRSTLISPPPDPDAIRANDRRAAVDVTRTDRALWRSSTLRTSFVQPSPKLTIRSRNVRGVDDRERDTPQQVVDACDRLRPLAPAHCGPAPRSGPGPGPRQGHQGPCDTPTSLRSLPRGASARELLRRRTRGHQFFQQRRGVLVRLGGLPQELLVVVAEREIERRARRSRPSRRGPRRSRRGTSRSSVKPFIAAPCSAVRCGFARALGTCRPR